MSDSEALKARAEQLRKNASRAKTFGYISLFFCIFWGLASCGNAVLESAEGESVANGFLTFSVVCLVGSFGLAFAFSSAKNSALAQSKEAAAQEAARRQRQAERSAQKSREKADAEAKKRDRDYSLNSLTSTHDNAVQLKQAVPALLQSTDAHLRRAEQEFQRGAYSPFWESIEGATRNLAEVADNLQQFNGLVQQHNALTGKLASEHRTTTPDFPVRLTDIYVAEQGQELSQRMDMQVAKAQTDYHFATIYEQRRTSAIMIAGFTTLGSAISGMTDRITSQLVDVVRSVDAVGRSTGSVASSIDEASRSASAQSAEALRMLDNIQRRRLPYSGVDRDY